MILGIGNDMIDIRRIENSIQKHGSRFTERCFTEHEQKRADSQKNRSASYAKRFAAKEACVKALGTGIAQGVFWCDMEIKNNGSGRPEMKLYGRAKQIVDDMLPSGHIPVIHLSISDDFPWAQAFVVIEARPK